LSHDLDIDDRLGPALAFKFAANGDTGVFDGYASTFGGPPDSYGDIVAPGAFTKSLSEHQAAGTMPAMLWAHDGSQPIGKWLDMHEDPMGLKATGRLTLDVQRARDAHALMKDDALGLSIGYRTRDAAPTPGARRLLKDVHLFEASTVPMPADKRARILSVKSAFAADEITDPRAFEKFLRDAGFSRAFAKATTASGFKAAAGLRDADAAELADIASRMRAGSLQIRNLMQKDTRK
jgi:hypothetical protein